MEERSSRCKCRDNKGGFKGVCFMNLAFFLQPKEGAHYVFERNGAIFMVNLMEISMPPPLTIEVRYVRSVTSLVHIEDGTWLSWCIYVCRLDVDRLLLVEKGTGMATAMNSVQH